VLGATHGHIADKGAGNPEVKVFNWFKGQALASSPSATPTSSSPATSTMPA